jgi:hypothetical protein
MVCPGELASVLSFEPVAMLSEVYISVEKAVYAIMCLLALTWQTTLPMLPFYVRMTPRDQGHEHECFSDWCRSFQGKLEGSIETHLQCVNTVARRE